MLARFGLQALFDLSHIPIDFSRWKGGIFSIQSMWPTLERQPWRLLHRVTHPHPQPRGWGHISPSRLCNFLKPLPKTNHFSNDRVHLLLSNFRSSVLKPILNPTTNVIFPTVWAHTGWSSSMLQAGPRLLFLSQKPLLPQCLPPPLPATLLEMLEAQPLWWHFCHCIYGYICQDFHMFKIQPSQSHRKDFQDRWFIHEIFISLFSRPHSCLSHKVCPESSVRFLLSPCPHISLELLVFLILHTKLLLYTCCHLTETTAAQPLMFTARLMATSGCNVSSIWLLPLLCLIPQNSLARQEPYRLHNWQKLFWGH